jgi:hypothetical protein
MISLVNFGDSPFYFLFVLVMAILAVTLLLNLISAVTSTLIERRARRLGKRYQQSYARSVKKAL